MRDGAFPGQILFGADIDRHFLAVDDGQPDWLTDDVFKSVVPGAIYAGPIADDPPVATIYGAGKVVGYAFETSAIVDSAGFSGAPFQIIVGLDADGVISGVTVMQHDEPILNYGDIVDRLDGFIGQYPGLDYSGKVRLTSGGRAGEIDGISTATISARAFHHAIIQSARIVARSLGFASGDRDTAMVDMLRFEPLSWHDLAAAGAIRSVELRRPESAGLIEEAPNDRLYCTADAHLNRPQSDQSRFAEELRIGAESR